MKGLVALSLLLLSLPANAQQELTAQARAETKVLMAEADAAYHNKDYQQAADLYKQAYEKSQAPGFLYNLGQAYRLAQDCTAARVSYETFLREVPQSKRRARVEEFIVDARACEQRAAEEAQASSASSSSATPPAEPSVQLDEPKSGSTWVSTAGVASAGVGVIALGVSGYFAWSANSHSNSAEKADNAVDAGRHESAYNSAVAKSVGFGVAGGVAIIAGATMMWMGRNADEPGVAAVLSPTFSGLAWSGRF